MVEVEYKDVSKLDFDERAVIQGVCEREFKKIKRSVANACLVVCVKKINAKGGKDRRATYEAVLKVDAPSVVLHAEHSDWELQRALHRAFDNLKKQVDHKFKRGKPKWPGRIIKE